MKQFISKIIICAVMITFSLSCHKEKGSNSGSYSIPEAALSYLQIPSGRIFAYKDSATGKVDSVELKNYALSNAYQPPHTVWTGGMLGYEKTVPAYYYQQLQFQLVNVRTGTIWIDAKTDDPCYQTGPTTTFNNQVSVAANFNFSYGNRTIFRYPVDSQISFYIASLTIGEKMYTGVIKLSLYGDYYYWAKGVGIIKFSFTNGYEHYTYTLCN